ncbi:DUF6194 family protein [Taibaiella koreensis]|uniref:DUF6194 family protein n=1 Tax=Taibaiella koreensis TaxID=1268548 RepID=UPI000E599E77|nr:DUF6194 family protein [Taibaiella koreensis]
MNIDLLKDRITKDLKDSYITEAGGDFFFLYGADDRFPFATIVTADNDFDAISHLNREGVFRLSIGVGKESFKDLFGNLPSRPGIGGFVESGPDFTALDTLMPHPIYGNMYWVCVLNPTEATVDRIWPYLEEAYRLAVQKDEKVSGKGKA